MAYYEYGSNILIYEHIYSHIGVLFAYDSIINWAFHTTQSVLRYHDIPFIVVYMTHRHIWSKEFDNVQ